MSGSDTTDHPIPGPPAFSHLSLTIIVPVYRIERYVAQCLESLDAQDLRPDRHEVIIVDDGSTDGSSAIVKAWAESRPWARVHRQVNQGLGAARNTGLRLARGRYVWFVDGDDHLEPGVASSIVELAESSDLTMLALGVQRVRPDGGHLGRATGALASSPVVDGRRHLASGLATVEAWGYVYQREFLLAEGLWFPEGQLIEDVVFTTTALLRAPRVAGLLRTVYYYVQRPDSIMHLRTDVQTRRIIRGFSSAVAGLHGLRSEQAADQTASEAVIAMLKQMEQGYVFFALVRLIRSELPFQPTFDETVAPFRALGIYPLRHFPGTRFPGVHYRMLTVIVNRPWLARPCAWLARTVLRAMTRLHPD